MAVSDLGRARDPVTPYPLASPEDLAATARTVEAAGRRSLAFSADVTAAADLVRLMASIDDRFGGLDVLVA